MDFHEIFWMAQNNQLDLGGNLDLIPGICCHAL